jgi:hypothetical protein
MQDRDEHSLFIDNATGAIYRPEPIISTRDVKLTASQITKIQSVMRLYLAKTYTMSIRNNPNPVFKKANKKHFAMAAPPTAERIQPAY